MRGRRSAAGAAWTRRCCSFRCRSGASGVVVGRPRVRRSRRGAGHVVVVGGQVASSSVGRGCGSHAAVLLVSLLFERESCDIQSAAGASRTRRCFSCRCRLGARAVVVGRPRVRRARGGAVRVVVFGGQVAWSSVGRGCGAHVAVLLVSLSSGSKWRCLRSAAGAARTQRFCSCRFRLGASCVVVGRLRVRRARGGAACVVVVVGQVALSSVGLGCGAHAAQLRLSLSFGRKLRGRRSGGGESAVDPSKHVHF